MTGRVPEADARELADCYRALAPTLFSYAMLVTRGERASAEDLVQDAFQSAAGRWAKIRDLVDEDRLVRLKAITRNKAIDAYRRQRTAQARLADLALVPGASTGTHEAAMLSIAGARVQETLRTLPERQHLVAVMRFRDHMTIAAIADELGVSTGTVSSEIKKIRRILGDIINSYIDFDATP